MSIRLRFAAGGPVTLALLAFSLFAVVTADGSGAWLGAGIASTDEADEAEGDMDGTIGLSTAYLRVHSRACLSNSARLYVNWDAYCKDG